MKKQLNEIRRMQQLAGLLKEIDSNVYRDSIMDELEGLANDEQELQAAVEYWDSNAMEVEGVYGEENPFEVGAGAREAAKWIIAHIRK